MIQLQDIYPIGKVVKRAWNTRGDVALELCGQKYLNLDSRQFRGRPVQFWVDNAPRIMSWSLGRISRAVLGNASMLEDIDDTRIYIGVSVYEEGYATLFDFKKD